MKYCTHCGAAIEHAADGGTCSACGADNHVDQSATVEGDIRKEDWRSYVSFLRSHLVSPDSSVPRAGSYRSYMPGIFTAALSSLVLAIIVVINLKELMSYIYSLSNGYLLSVGNGFEIPYVSTFFRSLLLFLMQWGLLGAILLGAAKLLKEQLTPVQAYNIAGIAKLYIAAGSVAAMLAGFVSVSLAIILFTAAYVLSVMMLVQGLKSVMTRLPSYMIHGVITCYLLAQLILTRILF